MTCCGPCHCPPQGRPSFQSGRSRASSWYAGGTVMRPLRTASASMRRSSAQEKEPKGGGRAGTTKRMVYMTARSWQARGTPGSKPPCTTSTL